MAGDVPYNYSNGLNISDLNMINSHSKPYFYATQTTPFPVPTMMKLIYPVKFKIGKLFTLNSKDEVVLDGPTIKINRKGFNIILKSSFEEARLKELEYRKMMEVMERQQKEQAEIIRIQHEKQMWENKLRSEKKYQIDIFKKYWDEHKELKNKQHELMYKWGAKLGKGNK